MSKSTASAGATRDLRSSVEWFEGKARSDFLWTCTNLLKIKTEAVPLAPLTLIPTQQYLYERYARPAMLKREPLALVILKARRARVSTFWEAWFFWACRWFPGQAILIAAHLDRSVNELYEMVERFHSHLPEELRPPTKALNRKELAYAGLDSSISVEAARYMDISRGQLINHFHLAEAPYAPALSTVLSGISESVPRTPPVWSSLVLEGTANGQGTEFHEVWKAIGRRRGAFDLGGRKWQRCFINCFAHPDYWLPVPKGFHPTEEEVDMQQRYRIPLERVVWYRAMVEDLETQNPGRGRYIMMQEHPRNANEAFLASGSLIFPPEIMDPFVAQQEAPKWGYDIKRLDTHRWELVPASVSDAALWVWEEPKAGCEYAIGVDVSGGLGQHESTIVVVRMPGFVQVAEWGDNRTSSIDLAGIVAAVSRYYASQGRRIAPPLVNIDITGGWGTSTNSELGGTYAGEPLQLYVWEPFDRVAPAKVTGASRTGWIFSPVSKNVLVSVALHLMKDQMCQLPSQTIQEDLGEIQEEDLQRRAIEMSGHDRAVAWLLAVVAAWRKIARWSWPMVSRREEAPVMPTPQQMEPHRYDSTVNELTQRHPPGNGSTAGDTLVPWLLQI